MASRPQKKLYKYFISGVCKNRFLNFEISLDYRITTISQLRQISALYLGQLQKEHPYFSDSNALIILHFQLFDIEKSPDILALNSENEKQDAQENVQLQKESETETVIENGQFLNENT